MDDFINNRIYVWCNTGEEAEEFWLMCQKAGCTMSRRGDFQRRMHDEEWYPSLWTTNFMGEGKTVCSYWNVPDGDTKLPIINFAQLLDDQFAKIDNFLSLIQ